MVQSLSVGRGVGALAASSRGFGMIQVRHHFAGAAVAGDPAEVVGRVFFLKAVVGHQRAEAACRDAAGGAGGDRHGCRRP